MMTFKRMLIVPVAASAWVIATTAHADTLSLDRLDDVLSRAGEFGFSHIEEIEAENGDSVDIEGWLDDEWYADVRLSLSTGETLKEERERLVTSAWGMSEDDVRQAFDVARSEGMVAFEAIDIDESGMIEIEGHNDQRHELEVHMRQGSDAASGVERD